MEKEVSLGAHENDIALQELSVSKATKELKYLEKDANDLQKRLEKLQNDIIENEKARTAAKELLENENSRLKMLKARKLEKKN
jgi:septation ring formation regulator EzrA